MIMPDENNYYYLHMPIQGKINIHIKGGSIVPILDLASTALTVEELKNSSITLVVALDINQRASGKTAFDDGITATTLNDSTYTIVDYNWHFLNYTTDILEIQPRVRGYNKPDDEFPHLSTILIYGCAGTPKRAEIMTGDRKITANLEND